MQNAFYATLLFLRNSYKSLLEENPLFENFVNLLLLIMLNLETKELITNQQSFRRLNPIQWVGGQKFPLPILPL